MQKEQVKMCTCGRVRTHCPKCGKKPTYYKKTRSMDLSLVSGKQVDVYRCVECGDFTTDTECHAPRLATMAETAPVTQDNMVLGSTEHAFLLRDWVIEMQRKNKWGPVQVYIEAQKAGWHLEAFGDKVDEDVRQALQERGLLPGVETDQINETPNHANSPLAAEAPTEISLTEIIEAMKEERK